MKNKIVSVVLLLSVIACSQKNVPTRTEGCLGGFCFYGPLNIPETQLVEWYGDGFKKQTLGSSHPIDAIHTYYEPNQKLWVQFFSDFHGSLDVASVLVTQKELCEESFVPSPKAFFPTLKTPMGIGIGSTRTEIESVYGKPTSEGVTNDKDKLGSGLMYLEYMNSPENELLGATFYLQNNKVHSIEISATE